jgi:hypothetical protein
VSDPASEAEILLGGTPRLEDIILRAVAGEPPFMEGQPPYAHPVSVCDIGDWGVDVQSVKTRTKIENAGIQEAPQTVQTWTIKLQAWKKKSSP